MRKVIILTLYRSLTVTIDSSIQFHNQQEMKHTLTNEYIKKERYDEKTLEKN